MSFKHKILCNLGKHKYKPALRTYKYFKTNWTDTGEISYWSAHFLECAYCKERFFESDYRYTTIAHKGLQQAKHLWLDQGYIPQDLRDSIKDKKTKEKEPEGLNTLTNNDKINKMLLKALDTDSESEAQTCLQKARKAYQSSK